MNLENQLLEKFQVEELEKRYEFAWVDEVKVTASYEAVPGGTITVSTNIPIN
jgi:hypothetical protein